MMSQPVTRGNPSSARHQDVLRQHSEPEKPMVYEPPDLRGRMHVEKVTGEYRIREDECLADKLQHEEFELHFGKNKDARKLGHIDIKKAKQIYLDEIKASGLLSKQELNRLCTDDKYLAEEVAKRIQEEEVYDVERKEALEMQDEEFARYLEAKEKEKLEVERKRRLDVRIAQDRAAAERLQREVTSDAGGISNGVAGISLNEEAPQNPRGWGIDFEVGSKSNKTSADLNALKDAEIARKLQFQEAELEKIRVEEERDRRLAEKLQQHEAEKYEILRIKEQEKREVALIQQREKEQREAAQRMQDDQRQREMRSEFPDNDKRSRLQAVDATGKAAAVSHQDQQPYNSHNSQGRSNSAAKNTPQREGSQGRSHPNNAPQGVNSRSHPPQEYESYDPKRQGSHGRSSKQEPQRQDAKSRSLPQEAQRHGSQGRSHQQEAQRHGSQGRSHQQEAQRQGSQGKSQPPEYHREEQRRNSHSVQNSNASRKPEPVYLQAVDATGQPVERRLADDQRIRLEQARSVNQQNKGERKHYDNVAANIDPTYTSIDTLNNQRGREASEVRPASVIQNQKRNSAADGNSKKEKKKLFSSSKKEKKK